MRRLLRGVLIGLAGLVLLLLLAVGGIWWWAGTQGSLHWALGQLAGRQPVVVEGARGSLRTGVQASRLQYRQGERTVDVTQLQLAWQPLSLLQGTLRLDHLRAATVRVEDRTPPTSERTPPPQSLALPLHVVVEELSVGRFTWAGSTAVEAQDLSARYAYDGTAHQLDLRGLRMFDGHYRGRLRLGARNGLPLNAFVEGRIAAPVPGGTEPVPLLFEARLDGPVTALQAQLQVRAEGGGTTSSDTRATVTARLTPFDTMPLSQGRATLQALDVGALWPQAPHTALGGTVSFEPAGPGSWTLSADLRNGLPGPWDRKRLPAQRVRVAGEWRGSGQALVRELEAQLGGGRVEARGQWNTDGGWTLNATLAGVNPAALHTALAPIPVGGTAKAQGEGEAVRFDVALRAADGAPRTPAPAATDELAAAAGALELRELNARGRWAGNLLALPQFTVRTSDASLEAAVDVDLRERTGQGRAVLQAPGLQARAAGSVGERTGGGTVRLGASDLAAVRDWLQRLPFVPEAVGEQPVSGRADLQLAWQGGWLDPSVQGSLTVPQLEWAGGAADAAPWMVRDATLRVDGRLADARLELRGKAQSGARRVDLELSGRGGRRNASTWQGQLSAMQLAFADAALGPGAWRLAMRRAFDLRWSQGVLDAGAGEATLIAPARRTAGASPVPSEAVLAWEPLRWGSGQLRTAGRLTGLPMQWIELAGGPQLAGSALAGDLVFDAQWQLELAQTLRVRASLVRSRGDLSVLAENAEGGNTRVQAGVRDARLLLEGDGQAMQLTLAWDSERTGNAQGRLSTQLARSAEGGWQWPDSAPLSGSVQAQLPRLAVWSVLAPPGWRLRGSLAADVTVAGTRAAPVLGGTLQADNLALRSVVDGVELQGGRLRARLDGQRLLLEEFLLRGGGGEGGGTLTATGEGSWTDGAPQARVSAQLQRLRAGVRTDRQLTVSGNVQATVGPQGAAVNGKLRVDRARITLPDETAPRLGDDVIVRNAPGAAPLPGGRPAARAGAPGPQVALAVDLDLGDDFRVQGRGVATRLAGTLSLASETLGMPRITGVINTVGGEYQAYGQRLDIERGVLRFTGPADNPALDVLAIRPRIAHRVGVLVTGRAQAPFVRLYAEPDLPEAEKLSWLVLGRPAASGGAETALLQQAAVALFASRTGGGSGKGPAALLGLDELGFRRGDGDSGPAVTLGKRLGQNLYASYERSLSGALGTLYLFYDLSQRLTVRAQAGDRAAIDLILTFAYD